MKTGIFLALSVLLGLIGLPSHRQTRTSHYREMAKKVLEAREPKTTWRADTLLKADFDCDGTVDYAFSGQQGNRYAIGVLKGPIKASSKHWIITFESGRQSQDSLCSLDARINLEQRQDHKNRQCKGINLHDDMCDSFHIYWNRVRKKFVWSRL